MHHFKVYIIFFLLILFSSLKTQIKDDYIISEEGTNPVICVDQCQNIHASWSIIDKGIFYLFMDSLGNSIDTVTKFNYSSLSNFSELYVSQNNIVVVWLKGSMTYNSYIWGSLFSIENESTEDNIQFNDIFFDAERSSPDVCFLNDSIFVVVWSGQGPESGFSSGVYGQIYSTKRNFIGSNILLSDHYSQNTHNLESHVLKFPNQNKFLVTWHDDHSGTDMIYAREFNLDGTPVDSSFEISDSSLSNRIWSINTDVSDEGNFVIVWSAEKEDKWFVQWRWYDSKCDPYTSVENLTTSIDSLSPYTFVDIAIDYNGQGIVVWEQVKDKKTRIFAQRFRNNRGLYGIKFPISSRKEINNQYFPRVDISMNNIYTIWKETEIWSNIIDYYNPPDKIYINSSQHIPNEFMLKNYPNPFNSETDILYRIPQKALVRIKICNSIGQQITTIVNKTMIPGSHSILWSGKNNFNQDVTSGIYFCYLEVDHVIVKTIKLLIIR